MSKRLVAPKPDVDWMTKRINEILRGGVPVTVVRKRISGDTLVEPVFSIFSKQYPAGKVVHQSPMHRCVYTGKDATDLIPVTTMELYGSLVRGVFESHPSSVTIDLGALRLGLIASAVEGVMLALMEPNDFKTDGDAYCGPERIQFSFSADPSKRDRDLVLKGIELARYRNLQRFLGHLDPVALNPESYRSLIYRLVHDQYGVNVMEPEFEDYASMGLLNAVARGSQYNGYILAFRVDPKDGPTNNVAVRVGKGITYDTGGSISKGGEMPGMKLDMMGSAAVLSAGLYFLAHPEELQQSTYYVLCLAENRDGPAAYVPDEILTSYKGPTVENTHPDAEGRLVLADGLGWTPELVLNHGNRAAAILAFSASDVPDEVVSIVTIATLTGAAMMALSTPYSALFVKGDKQDDLTRLRQLGDIFADPVWPLPMSNPHYAGQMGSDKADLRNTGKAKPGGASQAAAFLAHFLPDDYKGEYIHLDIAGAVDVGMAGSKGTAKGLPQDAGVAFLIALDRRVAV